MKNKLKLLFAILIVFNAGSYSYAQLDIQAGINNSSLAFSIDGFSIETGSVIGFHAGINYSSKLSNSIYLVPGLLFSQKGANIELDFGLSSDESKLSSTYIDIPLMFHYQSNPEKGFFLQGGPNFSLLMSASSAGEDVKEDFKNIDLSLGIGAGYDLGQFKLGARVNFGLTTISEEEDSGSVSYRVIQLYGAYKL